MPAQGPDLPGLLQTPTIVLSGTGIGISRTLRSAEAHGRRIPADTPYRRVRAFASGIVWETRAKPPVS